MSDSSLSLLWLRIDVEGDIDRDLLIVSVVQGLLIDNKLCKGCELQYDNYLLVSCGNENTAVWFECMHANASLTCVVSFCSRGTARVLSQGQCFSY